jgi:hypothetical protein
MDPGKIQDSLDWLLRSEETGVRYLAERDLLKKDAKDLQKVQKAAHAQGPIAAVLANMDKLGFWMKPGPGYSPKYHGTVWSVILLAQLGASPEIDERVATACSYLLNHNLTEGGQFTITGSPSGTVDCIQGNLCASLLELGCTDRRLDTAFEWMARSVTGDGVAPADDKAAPRRYYAYKCGPDFACGANNKLPCAWGAAKVMLAFSKLPEERRTPLINKAIEQGADFLLSKDPAKADYPTASGIKPSGNWWKFGFPVFYVTDLLQIAEALAGLGYHQDPRFSGFIKVISDKQDDKGRWSLDYDYTGKTWGDFGPKRQPSQWVTLRALRVLKSL